MISVIIPTVQKKLKVLATLIKLLSEDRSVDEILVINNKPEVPLDLSGDKLTIYTPKENLYVNPSWNFGVSKIKNENFALLNDDMLVCKDFCKKIEESDIFNNETTGLIGVSPSVIKLFDETEYTLPEIPAETKAAFTPLRRYLSTGDWGNAIFGKKKNFYQIPDDLKIIYGDNYILYKNQINNKINYSITNLTCLHLHSVSSGSAEFSPVIRDDIINSKKYFKELERPVQKPKQDILQTAEFKIIRKGDICNITLPQNNCTLYLKYKEGNNVYKQELLSKQILKLLGNRGEYLQLSSKIAEALAKSQNTNG